VEPALSADGRFLAFASFATNLVPGDTNDTLDVFVRDLQTGTTERVSVAGNGDEGNDFSSGASVSRDGRYVAFTSLASNLVPGDTVNSPDIFVRDRSAGTTQMVSVDRNGSPANDFTTGASISPDGRYVAFASNSSNLVAGDNNDRTDVFVRDLLTGTTSLVSVNSDEVQSRGFSTEPSVSAHGRYIAFSSTGRLVPEDTGVRSDVYVRDLRAGTTEQVSVNSQEAQPARFSSSDRPSISPTGRYVAFGSGGAGLVPGDSNHAGDIFVRDRVAGTTRRVSVSSAERQAKGISEAASISANGRYVAFQSSAPNLVAGDTNGESDVFLRDRGTGTTRLVSVSSREAVGNRPSLDPSISQDGRLVAFSSRANNLTPTDKSRFPDVFLRNRAGR
jgi:Tol biopolymer transport system component